MKTTNQNNANGAPHLRVAMILPGLGRVQRGAETAFIELARGLSAFPDVSVTMFGSGDSQLPDVPRVVVPCVPRERFESWPRFPILRNERCYEEMSFILRMAAFRSFRPRDYDVALHCSYPFINWYLQLASRRGGLKSIFVTENGDWMCQASSREYKKFRCDGLICTNPEYFSRHKDRYKSTLIPNGVDPQVYHPRGQNCNYPRDPRIPADKKVILMVSAMIPSKRVVDGVRAAALVPDSFLVIAGDGPERQAVREIAAREMPGRHLLLGSISREQMPDLYRSADAFLHMSQDEPSCIAYLEAAASGLPIIIHDAPVPRWTLEETALYANTSHVEEVAAQLRRAVDPSVGHALGVAARKRVADEWSWAALSTKYRSFLYSCLRPTRDQEVACSL